MPRPACLALAAVAAVLSLASCARPAVAPTTAATAKASPAAPAPSAPLALVPADVARAGLVASFVLPSLDRSLASGVGLVKQAAPLPLDAAGVRDMLFAQAGLAPELARHIDIAAPMAGASVVGSRPGAALTAFSFAARSPGDATALIAALGRTVTRRGQAIQIENGTGDRGWFLPMGNLVVFADTDEALVRAGSLAVEARRASSDDLSVTLYPDMVARAAGTTTKAALARVQLELEERAASGGNKLGPEATRQTAAMVNYLGDTAAAELVLSLDAARGASVLARLRPKPGSRLESLARETRTIPVDPALLRAAIAGDDTGMLATSAYGQAMLDQVLRTRGKLPSDTRKPLVASARLLEALAEGLTGQFSMAGRIQPALSTEMIYPTRDPANGARIQAALLGADKDAVAAILRAATEGEGTALKVLKARRESLGKARGLHVTLAPVSRPDTDPAVRRLVGAGPTELFLAMVGSDRLAMTMGPDARKRMLALASADRPGASSTTKASASRATKSSGGAAPGATAPSNGVAEAVAAAGPRSFFYFLDLRQVVAVIAATGGNPRMRMLTGSMRAAMPILGGVTGDGTGGALTLDLTIPTSCFTAIGGLIQAALMPRN